MFKTLIRSLLLITLGAVGAVLLPPLLRSHAPSPAADVDRPTIESVRALSALVTLTVDVADVQLTDLQGWSGGVQVALLVKGQFQLATDLNESRFEQVDIEKRTAVLVLAPPQASSPRLDHDRTKLFAVSVYGLWELVPSDEAQVSAINRALQAAQASLVDAAKDGTQVERARRQTEALILSFFTALEWDVVIRWSDRS